MHDEDSAIAKYDLFEESFQNSTKYGSKRDTCAYTSSRTVELPDDAKDILANYNRRNDAF